MIEEGVRELAQAPNFAVYTSISARGLPMSIITWVDCDDEFILINTEVHRRNFRNVTADPRIGVLIMDRNDPEHYASVEGWLAGTVTGPAAKDHIEMLAQKYMGTPYDAEIRSERVILQISPKRQRVRRP